MSGERSQRLAKVLKKEISLIFQEEIHDPVIKAVDLLTVTDVDVSPDLKIAKVYLSFLGESQKTQAAFSKIESAAGFFRFKISEKLRDLKFMPEIRFYQDSTPAEAARLMNLFHQIEAERKKNERPVKNKKSNQKK